MKKMLLLMLLLLTLISTGIVSAAVEVPADIQYTGSDIKEMAYVCCQEAEEIPFCTETATKSGCEAKCPGACQKVTVQHTKK